MRLRKQFNNLKAGAKKVLVGLLAVSLISTASGVGSILTYATTTTEISCAHELVTYTYASENFHEAVCENCGEKLGVSGHNFVDGVCKDCGYNSKTNVFAREAVTEKAEESAYTEDDHPYSITDVTDGNAEPQKKSDSYYDEGSQSHTPYDNSSDSEDSYRSDSKKEDQYEYANESKSMLDHEHDYVLSIRSNHDGTHTLTATCSCGDTLSETQDCTYGDSGACIICGYSPDGDAGESEYGFSNGFYDAYEPRVRNDDPKTPIVTDQIDVVFNDNNLIDLGGRNIIKPTDNQYQISVDNVTFQNYINWEASDPVPSTFYFKKADGEDVYTRSINIILPSINYEGYEEGSGVTNTPASTYKIGVKIWADGFTVGADKDDAEFTEYPCDIYNFQGQASYDESGNLEKIEGQMPLYFNSLDAENKFVYKQVLKLTLLADNVSPTILYDGQTTKKANYVNSVEISADGFTVGKDTYPTDDVCVVYPEDIASDGSIVLHFSSGAGVDKAVTITGLNIYKSIGYPSVTFTGDHEIDGGFEDYCYISASGFYVCRASYDATTDVYDTPSFDGSEKFECRPEHLDENGVVHLFFKSKNESSDPYIYIVDAKPIIYTRTDLNILYNGEAKKDWYKESVEVTCDGYTIAESGSEAFRSYYLMNGEGTVEKLLRFKETATGRITNSSVTVNIDRTAPPGTLTVAGKSSSTFLKTNTKWADSNDEKEISLEYNNDAPDGVSEISDIDYVRYYISEDFYSVPEDLIADVPIRGAGTAWKTYDPTNKPTTKINKKNYVIAAIADMAGNITYISTGYVLSDTSVIAILYNGGAYKEWFGENVSITAEGYEISKHGDDVYTSSYNVTQDGVNELSLDFRRIKTGFVRTYDLVIRIDKSIPGGKIEVENYVSKTFQKEDTNALYTSKALRVSIKVNDKKNGGVENNSGIDYIAYYIADKFFPSSSELTAYMAEKELKWRIYDPENTPIIEKDRHNYIYAAIYDKAGHVIYLSTGDVLCDTVAPEVKSQQIGVGNKEDEYKIAVGGTDDLSGISHFLYICKPKLAEEMALPDENEMSADGKVIEVNKEEKLVAAGTTTLTGIDMKQNYVLYFAAVDKCGNIGLTTSENLDAKKEPEKKEESQPLTPAPNGIAGSGNGSSNAGASSAGAGEDKAGAAASNVGAGEKAGEAGAGSSKAQETGGGSSSSSASSQSSKSDEGSSASSSTASSDTTNPLGDNDREISRTPYISDATGETKIGEPATGGWDKITSEVNKAENGATISVDMSGTSNVPEKLFDTIGGRDLVVKLKMAEGVEWEIKGNKIASDSVTDRNLGVRVGSRNIPDKVVSSVADVYPHVEFSMIEPKDLGFESSIIIPVDKLNAGMNATLYKYDNSKKELVAAGTAIIDDNGKARFDITEAADYTVVITPEKVSAEIDNGAYTDEIERNDFMERENANSSKIRLSDIFVRRGGATIWLLIIGIVSALLCLAILFAPTMQRKDYDDEEYDEHDLHF